MKGPTVEQAKQCVREAFAPLRTSRTDWPVTEADWEFFERHVRVLDHELTELKLARARERLDRLETSTS